MSEDISLSIDGVRRGKRISQCFRVYAVGVYELTYQANKLSSVNYRYLETMIVAALIYFVLTYTMTKLLGLLERRMRRSENSVA